MPKTDERTAVLPGPVWVGIDRENGTDTYVECRHEPDGTITILDSYAIEQDTRHD